MKIKQDPARAASAKLKRVLAFITDFYRKGHEGKAVVIGCNQQGKSIAFAASSNHSSQQKFLTTMARYLFSKYGIDRYMLIMPARSGGKTRQDVLVAELSSPEGRWRSIAEIDHDPEGQLCKLEATEAVSAMEPLLANLTAPSQTLPGIMRRKLEKTYRALQIPVPNLQDWAFN